MKSVVIGGNSREVGKTSLAASLIAATRDLQWTAVKLTQFGHGICSRDGTPCDCAVENPLCPYEITAETGEPADTDSARMLAAGAANALWVRVAMGQLPVAMPAIREALSEAGNVLFESNSIVDHLPPDVYLSVLNLDIADCKQSAARLATAADAFVLTGNRSSPESWEGFEPSLLRSTPVFEARPPTYCTAEIVSFVRQHLLGAASKGTHKP